MHVPLSCLICSQRGQHAYMCVAMQCNAMQGHPWRTTIPTIEYRECMHKSFQCENRQGPNNAIVSCHDNSPVSLTVELVCMSFECTSIKHVYTNPNGSSVPINNEITMFIAPSCHPCMGHRRTKDCRNSKCYLIWSLR